MILSSHRNGRDGLAAARGQSLPLCLRGQEPDCCRHGEGLSRGLWHLPQQGENLPHIDQQRGSSSYCCGYRIQLCLARVSPWKDFGVLPNHHYAW